MSSLGYKYSHILIICYNQSPHPPHLFLKVLLGVKRSTNTHCLVRETGQLPIYFDWIICVACFWNSPLTTNNALLSKVNEADFKAGSPKRKLDI